MGVTHGAGLEHLLAGTFEVGVADDVLDAVEAALGAADLVAAVERLHTLDLEHPRTLLPQLLRDACAQAEARRTPCLQIFADAYQRACSCLLDSVVCRLCISVSTSVHLNPARWQPFTRHTLLPISNI